MSGIRCKDFCVSSIFRVPSALSGRPQSCSATIWRQVLQIENLCLHLRLLRPWNASISRGHLRTRELHTRKNDGFASRDEFFFGCSIDRFLSRMSGSDRSIVSIRSSTNLPTRSYFFSFYKYLSFNRSIFRVSHKLTNNRRDCYLHKYASHSPSIAR